MGGCFSQPDPPPGTHSVPTKAGQQPSEPAFPRVDKSLKLTNSMLGHEAPQDVTDYYEIGDILGAGQFGTTRTAVHKATGEKFACKSIAKSQLKGMETIASVKQELQIMHHVAGHENVVALKEAFEDHHHVHLIMELCSGGDLVDAIMAKGGTYTERDAAALVRKMLKVVAFCHEMGVMHRDLKPDNFLLSDRTANAELKATDFGLSTFFKPGQVHSDVCGTAYYISPELLLREYDEKADVWAVGVILFILLSGRPPFEAVEDDDIFRMIVEVGKPEMDGSTWQSVSEPAKAAVRRMMTYDHKQRPSAKEMLLDPWVRENGVAGDNIIQPEVLHRMKSFAAMNKLKKQALLLIANRLPADEIRGLKELFASMDENGDGMITVEELSRGLASKGASLPKEELEQLMSLADLNGNKSLDWMEFVSSTMHVCKLQQEEHLMAVFKHFDADNNGYITREELTQALSSEDGAAKFQTDTDIATVLQECDKDGDGRINYSEFVSMMLPRDELSQSKAARFAERYTQLRKQQPQVPVIKADASAVPDQVMVQA